MVVVMSASATDHDVRHVVERVEGAGDRCSSAAAWSAPSSGWSGTSTRSSGLELRAMPGVADVHRISVPYKLVSREHHPERSVVWVGRLGQRVPIGPGTFTFIAGPCAVESADQTAQAAHMAAAGAVLLRGGAFKPRTSPYSFQGLGVPALRLLAEQAGGTRARRGHRGNDPARRGDEHVARWADGPSRSAAATCRTSPCSGRPAGAGCRCCSSGAWRRRSKSGWGRPSTSWPRGATRR